MIGHVPHLALHTQQDQQKRERDRIASQGPPVVLVVPSRVNPEEQFDRLDELNVGETPVGVEESDWERVLKRLGHMQSQYTSHVLKLKTIEALWEHHGASTSEV